MSGVSLRPANAKRNGFNRRDMMRIAIAGSGGLAWYIAHFLQEETGHQILWLSRAPKAHLQNQGYQVMVVDYESRSSLEYALRGVDVVISIVPGLAQIKLIDAAIRAGVRRFAPAEFEGRPGKRPSNTVNQRLDRGKTAVLEHLQNNRSRIESTVFVCGVLYERFGPGGLRQYNMGAGSRFDDEGDFLVDIREMTAEAPYVNSASEQVSLCLTSGSDVGRFVVKSLDLGRWPPEMIMRGERLTSYEMLSTIARARGKSFATEDVTYHTPTTLNDFMAKANAEGTSSERQRVRELISTLNGRYDYNQTNLNQSFPDIVPKKFENWLTQAWAGQ